MITSDEHAIAVQARRYASDKRGVAKAVRTYIKFKGLSQADRILFLNKLSIRWYKDKVKEKPEVKKERHIECVPQWYLIRAVNNFGERYFVHAAPKGKPIKLTSDIRAALAFEDIGQAKCVRDDVLEFYDCTLLRMVP